MTRFVIPALLLLSLLLAACASGTARNDGTSKRRPCPASDLTVACGRTAWGELFRL